MSKNYCYTILFIALIKLTHTLNPSENEEVILSKKYDHNFSGNSVVNQLENHCFYFIGQLHCNQANNLIEQEIFFALHQKKGVQYNIIEFSHSAAFLINEYLKTGQDTILKAINSIAPFSFVKSIKNYNEGLQEGRKIKFFGLDFEGRFEGRLTKYAIKLIAKEIYLAKTDSLSFLLEEIIHVDPSEMKKQLEKLRNFLSKNQQQYREQLKDYFIDLFLISSAQYEFTPKRDDAMVKNFNLLYKELLLVNKNPKFFGSFGIGHINPSNRKGIAMRLKEDENSPVRKNVTIIGVQYLNCRFEKENMVKSSSGNLNFLCDKSEIILPLEKDRDSSATIQYLPAKAIKLKNCSRNLSSLSGLVIIKNFNSTNTCMSWQM